MNSCANTIALWHWHSSIFLSSYNSQPVCMSYNQKVKCNRSTLPNLLPFLGIAMKEPRLPPITLWGLRSGGFLKEPVYWWRKECMLWDVGGLPFFTIGSVVHGIQESSMVIARVGIAWEGLRRQNKAKVVIEIIYTEVHFFGYLFKVLELK